MSLNTDNQYISCFLTRQRELTSILLALLTLLSSCSSSGGGGGFIPLSTKTISSPSSISAVAGNGSVTVSWAAVNGATSYFVYSSLSSPVSHATKHTVPGTTFIDTGLANGDRYYYVVTAVKAGEESLDSSEVSAVPGSTGSIFGKITYEDKELGTVTAANKTGFTGNATVKAVRYATVDVVNEASPFTPIYTTWTNSLGMYNIPISTGSTSVYIRVNSEALSTGGTHTITVMNLSGTGYGVPSTTFTFAGSVNVNITIPTTNAAAGAFNILDVMTTGYDFIKYLSGSYPVVPLDVFWEPGNTDGTYFCSAGCSPGNGIYVLSQTGGDTDEYDDDVLWHEFGHFVAATYSLDDSQGGSHFLGENDQDLRLSWSEGWGDFFPGAVKTWLNTSGQSSLISSAPGVSLTTYVDTSATGGFSFDFGNPAIPVNSQYASNEVAVAKLLTDLNASFAPSSMWSVITDFQSNQPPATEPINLELFWDRWLSVNTPDGTDLATLQTRFAARSIFYQNDAYEPNNIYSTAMSCTVGIPQTHTLYSSALSPDSDYLLFSATSGTYLITTSNLLNGADTYLTLYDSDGTTDITPVSSNTRDNTNGTTWLAGNGGICVNLQNYDCYYNYPNWLDAPLNNTTNLASRMIWMSPGTKTVYIKVSSSPYRPKSAGRYGSYTLSITKP